MDEDIKQYVTSCMGCQLAKAKISRKDVSMAIRQASQIFEVFSMDLIDMWTTSNSYRYILVLMDYFTGFVLLYNLRNKNKGTVLKALWDAFTIFGPPQTLLSDRGKEFMNSLVEKFTNATGIQQVLTYSYHAQGNAKNERSHRVIEDILRIFCEQKPGKWHRYTKGIQYIINTRPNLETTISPYEAIFGFYPRNLANISTFSDYNHEEMQCLRTRIREIVRAHNKKKLMKAARPKPQKFKPGDLVKVVKTNQREKGKLLYPGSGPYKVLEPIATSGYKLQHILTSSKIVDAPREWLQPFHARKEDGIDIGENKEQENESEEEIISENEEKIESDIHNEESNTRDTRQNNKELKILKAHNLPTKKAYITKPEVGNMAIVKEDHSVRIGEIIEDADENWKLHMFGTLSMKTLPRTRWKFYPRWVNPNTDEIIISRIQNNKMLPDKLLVPKENVYVTFTKLHLNGTIPTDILDKITSYQLNS